MKLYTTINSERKDKNTGQEITKGHGGNEYLSITPAPINGVSIGAIKIEYFEAKGSLDTYDIVSILYFPPHYKEGVYQVIADYQIPKGKKQKTAKHEKESHCNRCYECLCMCTCKSQ